MKRQFVVWTVVFCVAGATRLRAEHAVEVDIENTSGEKKTDWPVLMSVYQVFGRNLPAGSLNPKGYHVYDETGRELEHMIEPIPPYDVESNNELVFRIPAMEAGAKITCRITNTPKDSARRAAIDYVNGRHNLIRNGGFEEGKDLPAGGKQAGGSVAGYKGPGRLDAAVKRSGKSSLLLEGTRGIRCAHEGKLSLHKGSRYYGGAWCKTDNVARNGLSTGSRGAYFAFRGEGKSPAFKFSRGFGGVALLSQCGTRDWNKSRFDSYYGKDLTAWGVYEDTVVAASDTATLQLVLDQKRQYTMDSDLGRWWVDDLVLLEQPTVRVRFDKALAPHLKDGVFVFTRPISALHGFHPKVQLDKPRPGKLLYAAYVSYPFAHEAAKELDGFAVRGQRLPFLIGLYHTRPLKAVRVTVEGGALAGPGGAKLPVEAVEFSHGYLGQVPTHFLLEHEAPVDFQAAPGIRYFLLSFLVPKDAKPGRYTGTVRIAADGKKDFRSVPLTLRVQDLLLPTLKETYVGYIFQGGRLLNDEGLSQYARSGFSSLTTFCGFLPFARRDGGGFEVDLEALEKKMNWVRSYGIEGVCIHSDVELDPQWGPGRLFRKSGGTKQTYQREIKRMYAAAKRRRWPRIISMIWDEPAGHGGVQPKLGWVNEVVPDAYTTLDVDFRNIAKSLDYVNLACIDNPANVGGPELYRYASKRGKRVGFCGSAKPGEVTRYQMGMLMIGSGAVLQQPWHLENKRIMGKYDGKIRRSLGLVSAGRGVDDLKIYRLLQARMEAARKDPERRPAVRAAEQDVKRILHTWNGDTAPTSNGVPYLGWASTWGHERFYDDWQERMARHAARIKGVQWVE